MSVKNFFLGVFKYSLFIFSLMVVGGLSTFVTLRLFTSGDEVVVPDVTGKAPMDAIQILKKHGLQLKIAPQKRTSEQVPEGKIAGQQPDPSRRIKRGRSISVYLSLGPEKIVVPDLVGQTARVATMTLTQRGLHQGKMVQVRTQNGAADQVLGQFPVAGTELRGSRAVNLLVSSGPASGQVFIMPDVVGRPLSEVSAIFRSAGLRIGSALPIDYPGIASGTIVKQSPLAGYKVSSSTYIGLYYSKAPGGLPSETPQPEEPSVQ